MAVQRLEQQTYLPEPAEQVASVLSFIKAQQGRGGEVAQHYFLAGAGERGQVEIPKSVYEVLVQVLEAMAVGKAVTVVPQSQMLTTQQAADLLGVSRPTVVKLIDEGVLPGETPGKRRRMVKLDDALAYRARRREEQYQALVAASTDYDEPLEDPAVVEVEYRRERAEAAADRRARRGAAG
jgi:excisionase family DNA binding protein